MASRTSSSSTFRDQTLLWLIALFTLAALSFAGLWELLRGGAHRSHLLLVFLGFLISGVAVLGWQFLRNRAALAETQLAHDRMRNALLAGNSVAWDLDVKTGEDRWFGDLKTMFGIASETHTIQQGDFYRRVHPDDRRRVAEAVAHAQENHSPYSAEFRVIREDGTVGWVSASGEFRHSRRGVAERMFGIATDITDRKLAERAREKSEEKFSKVFHQSPIPMTLTSTRDHRFLDVNEAFERETGWRRDEVIGRTPFDLNLWVDPNARETLVQRAIAEGGVRDLEIRFLRKDGRRGVGLGSVELIQIADEPCILSATVDITDRKLAEETLRQKEADLAEAQRLAHVGSWQYDLKSLSLSWSEELRRIHGLDPNQPTPSYDDFPKLFTEESWQRLQETMAQAIEAGEVAEADLEIVRPDGSRGWVATSGKVVRDASGEVIAVSGTSQDITERKHAEEALRRREHDLAEAQRLGHVGSWEWDIRTGVTHWSEELYRIYGLDPARPAPTLEELPKLHTAQAWNQLQQAMEAGSFPDMELELVRPDGTKRWIRTRFDSTRNSAGIVTELRGVSQDITEEKQTRDQLQESEQRFRRVVEQIGDALVVDDVQGRIVFANDQFLKLFGRRRDELENVMLEEYVSPEYRRELRAHHDRRMSGEELSSRYEFQGMRRDDTRLWIQAEVVSVKDHENKVVGSQRVLRDITEQKRAEQVLRESEERFRLVANTAPVMIWMCGTDNKCTYVNKPWLDFTGRTFEQELGDGWLESLHTDDLQSCMEMSQKGFGSRTTIEVQYRLRRHDGQYRWMLDLGVPRFNQDGTFAGYIGSCIDITERKQAEEAMATIGRRLIEAHEEERTWIGRELHDDINQRLALLSVELDRWSHEARANSQIRNHVRRAQDRITEICRDVQSLSHRLHSSKLEYLGLAMAANSFCRELSENARVEVTFTHEGVPRHLSKEASLCMFRVLQEALQNAVKYSGVASFNVDLHGSPNAIELTVVDSGAGFDPEEAMSRHGLGLISMRERLQLVNGEISIRSKPGAGTTIHARVPLQNPESQGWQAEAAS